MQGQLDLSFGQVQLEPHLSIGQVKFTNLFLTLVKFSFDPFPVALLKEYLDLPTLCRIVNLSLESGQLPYSLKTAVSSSRNLLWIMNSLVIISLSQISKSFLKLSRKLWLYVSKTTFTALTRVHNDILLEIDNHHYVILFLLDLSAAFDTLDHDILLKRLDSRFSI